MFRLLLTLILGCSVATALLPDQVVVVYNTASKRSKQCAHAYCNKRGVPHSNCLGITTSKVETITRQEYDEKIRYALLLQMEQKGWNLPALPGKGLKPVRAIVLMPDMPLRIKEDAEPGKKPTNQTQNCASVDSELMLLGAKHPINGPLLNPYFNKSGRLEHTKPPVLAVTRIDAPDNDAITRMINHPVEVERRGGLWGWAVVDNGGPYATGDEWFDNIARKAKEQGVPLFFEESRKLLPTAFPLMLDTAVYFGWYKHYPCGPFSLKKHASFRFAPGAIASHLHSYSGTSVRYAGTWIGSLLLRGAAVVSGNVFEPTLGGTLRLDIFYDRLMKGYTVAEAGLMATPWVSWQGVILGDPLYRPFGQLSRNAGPAGNVFVQWRKMLTASAGSHDQLERQVRQRMGNPSYLRWVEMLAWHYAEKKSYSLAIDAFGLIAGRAQDERNRVRAALMQASLYFVNKDERNGRLLMQELLEKTRQSPFHPAVQETAEIYMPELRPAPAPKPSGK